MRKTKKIGLAIVLMAFTALSLFVAGEAAGEAAEVAPSVFQSTDNTGYPLSSDTEVSKSVIGQNAYRVTVEGDIDGSWKGDAKYVTYWSSGTVTVKIDRMVGAGYELNGTKWSLSYDTWGEYNNQKVCGGADVGKVGWGKILIQKKTYGSWSTVGTAIDSDNHSFVIPSDDLNRGSDYRVIAIQEYSCPYSYERHYWTSSDYAWAAFSMWAIPFIGSGSGVETVYDHKYVDVAEVFTFHVCSSNSSSLVIKNLTVTDVPAEPQFWFPFSWATDTTKQSKPTIEPSVYDEDLKSKFATMGDGSMSVTGFMLDRGANTYLQITVKKDYKAVDVKWRIDNLAVFTDEGRYDIEAESSSGHSTSYTVYVMHTSRISEFIGECPVKYTERAFSRDSDVPAYIGAVSLNYTARPAVGFMTPDMDVIVNGDSSIPFSGSVSEKMDVTSSVIGISVLDTAGMKYNSTLNQGGHYEIAFSWGKEGDGDRIVHLYSFDLIEEDDAPGPLVNRENLLKTCRPIPAECWGFSLASSGTQSVTFVYESEEAAINALTEHERGRIAYIDGKLFWGPEDKRSQQVEPVDLEGMIGDHVKSMVSRIVLDPSTVITVEKSEGIDDILSLRLTHPVVVLGEGQFQRDMDIPVIGGERRVVVEENGQFVMKNQSKFMLIDSGECGLDCASAVASCGGRTIQLSLDVPLEDQLEAAGMSGLVTLTESTVYGRTASYCVWMASDGDVSVTLEVSGKAVPVSCDTSLCGYMPMVTSVDSPIPCVFRIWPTGFVQEAETLLPEELMGREFAPGEWIVEAVSGSGKTWTTALSATDVTTKYIWSKDLRSVTVSFDGTGKYISVESSCEAVSDATCTQEGMVRHSVSGTFRGVEYHSEKMETVPMLGHDYAIDCCWSPDGRSVDVEFKCSHDPAAHSGRFTIAGPDIVVEDQGGSKKYSVDIVHEGVPVSTSLVVKAPGTTPVLPADGSRSPEPSGNLDPKPAGSGMTSESDSEPGPMEGIASFLGGVFNSIAGALNALVSFVIEGLESIVKAIGEFFSGLLCTIGRCMP